MGHFDVPPEIEQNFGGFLLIKSERKLRLTQTWSHMTELIELHKMKHFVDLLRGYCNMKLLKIGDFSKCLFKLLLMKIIFEGQVQDKHAL